MPLNNTHTINHYLHCLQLQPLHRNLSPVINLMGVPVYLIELSYKNAVTISMVVDWVVLVLELRFNEMVQENAHRVLSVSLD